ncbi:MAG: EF-hand domain-containing protein [Rhizobiaceae bacterium]|nr:EF-hand domain-containing protein [Rhizobiaceae bacterium]
MKPGNLLALFAAVFCATTGSAYASDVESARAKFREIDRNGDRAIQFSEIAATRVEIFDRMDINRNGILDNDEIANVRKVAQSHTTSQQRAMFGEVDVMERMRLMDTNGDGVLSRTEFAGFVPPHIKAADRNGDATLSIRELRALRHEREKAKTR